MTGKEQTKKEEDDEEEEGEGEEDEEEDDDDDDDDSDAGHEDMPKLQRSVFYWVTDDKDADAKPGEQNHRTIYADQVAKKGIPLGILHNYVMEEVNETVAFLSLPLTFVLVLSYSFMVMGHVNPAIVRAVQDSIEFDIVDNANFAFDGPGFMGHKAIDDVNSLTDFWSWFNNGFVPLMFHFEHPWSEYVAENNDTTPGGLAPSIPYVGEMDYKRGMYIYYNRIVGGFKMVQERADRDESGCTTVESLLKFYGTNCVGGKGYELDPEMLIARLTSDPQREVWAYVNSPWEQTQERVLEWETSGWLDKKTKKIEISVAFYNAEYGLHSLVTVNFFFSRGGHIWKKIIPLSTYANWVDRKMLILIDFIWILSMFAVWILEVQEMLAAIKSYGAKWIKEYLDFWNIIDWASIVLSLLVLSMFSGAVVMTDLVNKELETLGEMKRGTWQYNDQVKRYMEALHTCVHYVHKLSLLMSGYPLIIVFRLLKAFHSQPRLAAVTKTLECAAIELIHFMIIFLFVFLSFAVSGVVLFGRGVEEFATFPRAINSCFLILMGAWDWDAIKVVGRREAQMWLGTYLIVNVLLLMNMLLAIIMDAYSDVKGDMGAAETLVEEAMQVFRRWKGARTGEVVPLSKILNAIEMERKVQEMGRVLEIQDVDDDSEEEEFDMDYEIVTGEVLCDWLEKSYSGRGKQWTMTEDQALELIQAAVENFYDENKGSATKNEVIMHVRKIEYRTKKMKDDLDREEGRQEGSDEEDEDDDEKEGKDEEEPADPFVVPQDLDDDDDDEEGKPVKVKLTHVASWLSEELPRFLQEIRRDRIKAARKLTQLHTEIDELRDLVEVGKKSDEVGLPPWQESSTKDVAGGLGATFGQLPSKVVGQLPSKVREYGEGMNLRATSHAYPTGRRPPSAERRDSVSEDGVDDEDEEPSPKLPGGGLRATGMPPKKRMSVESRMSVDEGSDFGMDDAQGVAGGHRFSTLAQFGEDMEFDDPDIDIDDGELDPDLRGADDADVGAFMGGIPDLLIASTNIERGRGKGKGKGKGKEKGEKGKPPEFKTFHEAQEHLRKIVWKKQI